MTVRSFWTIMIKILGIWLGLGFLAIIPQFISALTYFGSNRNDNLFAIGYVVTLFLLTIGIYTLILRLFVFKTAWLIDKLHLDKGFEEEKFEMNVPHLTVLNIAIIVIGGIVFVDGLPQLFRQAFVFLQQDNRFGESSNSGWIIFYIAKTILGYLLMTNSQFVVRFIDAQKPKHNNLDELEKAPDQARQEEL